MQFSTPQLVIPIVEISFSPKHLNVWLSTPTTTMILLPIPPEVEKESDNLLHFICY